MKSGGKPNLTPKNINLVSVLSEEQTIQYFNHLDTKNKEIFEESGPRDTS